MSTSGVKKADNAVSTGKGWAGVELNYGPMPIMRRGIDQEGLDGFLRLVALVCAIEARSLEGIHTREAEKERDKWRARHRAALAYQAMAERVEGR
ncbi:MAG TPA: hypothetical protein VEI97_11300 [bacterium]|nr:hypothetical protein [bacterium]